MALSCLLCRSSALRPRFLMIIYAKCVYALVCVCECVCVQSLVSILDSHATLPVLEVVVPACMYEYLVSLLACFVWLIACVCVCVCFSMRVWSNLHDFTLAANLVAAAATATNWQLIAASNVCLPTLPA